MSARTIHRKPRTLVPLLLLGCFTFAGCSSSSDDGPVVPPGTGTGQKRFSALLDQDQVVTPPSTGVRFRVTVTNAAPSLGTFQTPVWIGFHDGTFEIFNEGAAASVALERLAEDGNLDPLRTTFAQSPVNGVQDTLAGVLGPEPGPIAPGESVSRVFELNPAATTSRYMSFASMVIPSNDAFVANDDPQAIEIFDATGNFIATDFIVAGGAVYDAGTEVNTELPEHTAFFGQTVPNTGIDEGGVVHLHPGFLDAGSGGILDDPMFLNAQFTAPRHEMLVFTFEELPAGDAPLGLATVEFVSSNSQVAFVVAAENLSGPALGVRFHEGLPGINGPSLLDVTGFVQTNSDGSLLAQGTIPAPTGFLAATRAGTVYITIPTALNTDGELRGQVAPREAFIGQLDPEQEVGIPVIGDNLRVTVRNLAPHLGTHQSPVWVGFHDGTFESAELGFPASTHFPVSNVLELLAEDGRVDPMRAEFGAQACGATQGVLAGQFGPLPGSLAPGETVSMIFRLDPFAATSRFFSFGSMVLPSNDAFIANADPRRHPVFDDGGRFVAQGFRVPGTQVLDAGTEVNDEIPAHTPLLGGHTVPGIGVQEIGVVRQHPGFLPLGEGGILDDPLFMRGDFGKPGYELLEVRFDVLGEAEPGSGTIVARLNEVADELEFILIARDLSGPVTGLHFHEGAPGVSGPVVIDLGDTIQSDGDGKLVAQGTKAVDSLFVAVLRAGNIYVNVHTNLNPDGEIRGQLRQIGSPPDPEPTELEG